MAEEWAVKLELPLSWYTCHWLIIRQDFFCTVCSSWLVLWAANEPEPCQCSRRLWLACPSSDCDKEIRQKAEMGKGKGLGGEFDCWGKIERSPQSPKEAVSSAVSRSAVPAGIVDRPSNCLPLPLRACAPAMSTLLGFSSAEPGVAVKKHWLEVNRKVRGDSKQYTSAYETPTDCGGWNTGSLQVTVKYLSTLKQRINPINTESVWLLRGLVGWWIFHC